LRDDLEDAMDDTKNINAALSLPADFRFNEVRSLPTERLLRPLDFAPSLGPLVHFKGKWAGTGFNMIFRPQNFATSPTPLPQPAHGPNDNILELNLTTEQLVFSESLGSVPNRGFAQGDIFLNGVPYLQTVQDVTEVGPHNPDVKPVGIHVEPGIWIAVPSTTNPAEPTTVSRMASIPHGTTILLQGNASATAKAGPPDIPKVDPTPFLLANPHQTVRFPSQTATDKKTFRLPQDLTAHIASGKITQAILDDPNTVLRNQIAGQTIVETVTIHVASAPETPAGPAAIPAVGGGTDNIAFLTGSGSPNGVVPAKQDGPAARKLAGVMSTFWIETVEHIIHLPVFQLGQAALRIQADPHPVLKTAGPIFEIHPTEPIHAPMSIKVHSKQIQYSQVVLLNFAPLSWPHVSVATLTPAASTVIPVPWASVVRMK